MYRINKVFFKNIIVSEHSQNEAIDPKMVVCATFITKGNQLYRGIVIASKQNSK